MEELKLVRLIKDYQLLLTQCQQELEQVHYEMGANIDLDTLKNMTMETESMVRVVFVGQYSAGKSSIIKMLTKNENIKVGAAITTQDYTPYKWNGLYLVDTPGIKTGLREDHDAKTEKAIQEADLIVFVIDIGLFNPTILKYFKKLAYDMNKANQMILVVNKMAGGGEIDVIKQDLQQVLTQPYKNTTMLPLSAFHPSFIDAASYLEALTETDEEIQQELYEISNYSQFVYELNNFAEEKGLYGKLKSRVQQLQDYLESIFNGVTLCAKEDYDNQNSINDILYQAKEFKREKIRELEQLYDCANQDIRRKGRELAFGIFESSREELQNKTERIDREIQDNLQKLTEQRDTIIEEIQEVLPQYANEITDQMDLVVLQNSEDLTVLQDTQYWNLKFTPKLVNDDTKKAINHINSDDFHQNVTNLIHRHVHNGFLENIPVFGNGRKKSEELANQLTIAAAGFVQLANSYGQKIAEDNAVTRMNQIRQEIRKYYEDLGDSVYRQGKQDIDRISDGLEEFINRTEYEYNSLNRQKSSESSNPIKEIVGTLQNQCDDLLQKLE